MPDLVEQMYCSQQIFIPPNLPSILKRYAKAAIRTQPGDLLTWSSAYFRALAEGVPPPAKDRIEYPPVDSPSGLSPGFLKVLINQIGKGETVNKDLLEERWRGVCLNIQALHDLLAVGMFGEDVNWLEFLAICAGTLQTSLTKTMIQLCELLTEEPEGGSASIPVSTFLNLYKYLAKLDCGPVNTLEHYEKTLRDDSETECVTEVLEPKEEEAESAVPNIDWDTAIDGSTEKEDTEAKKEDAEEEVIAEKVAELTGAESSAATLEDETTVVDVPGDASDETGEEDSNIKPELEIPVESDEVDGAGESDDKEEALAMDEISEADGNDSMERTKDEPVNEQEDPEGDVNSEAGSIGGDSGVATADESQDLLKSKNGDSPPDEKVQASNEEIETGQTESEESPSNVIGTESNEESAALVTEESDGGEPKIEEEVGNDSDVKPLDDVITEAGDEPSELKPTDGREPSAETTDMENPEETESSSRAIIDETLEGEEKSLEEDIPPPTADDTSVMEGDSSAVATEGEPDGINESSTAATIDQSVNGSADEPVEAPSSQPENATEIVQEADSDPLPEDEPTKPEDDTETIDEEGPASEPSAPEQGQEPTEPEDDQEIVDEEGPASAPEQDVEPTEPEDSKEIADEETPASEPSAPEQGVEPTEPEDDQEIVDEETPASAPEQEVEPTEPEDGKEIVEEDTPEPEVEPLESEDATEIVEEGPSAPEPEVEPTTPEEGREIAEEEASAATVGEEPDAKVANEDSSDQPSVQGAEDESPDAPETEAESDEPQDALVPVLKDSGQMLTFNSVYIIDDDGTLSAAPRPDSVNDEGDLQERDSDKTIATNPSDTGMIVWPEIKPEKEELDAELIIEKEVTSEDGIEVLTDLGLQPTQEEIKMLPEQTEEAVQEAAENEENIFAPQIDSFTELLEAESAPMEELSPEELAAAEGLGEYGADDASQLIESTVSIRSDQPTGQEKAASSIGSPQPQEPKDESAQVDEQSGQTTKEVEIESLVKKDSEMMLLPTPVTSDIMLYVDKECDKGDQKVSPTQQLSNKMSLVEIQVAVPVDETVVEVVERHRYPKWMNIPGIGPVVPDHIIEEAEKYFVRVSELQEGMVMPRNVRHFHCPPLELNPDCSLDGANLSMVSV